DQFYGDRSGGVKDAFGNLCFVATHKEDVSREEILRRAQARAKSSEQA
ncbi:MAG: glyoxalase, partial [Acidobacteria bacterium]